MQQQPAPLPPATADCQTSLQPAKPPAAGVPATAAVPWKMLRSPNGQTRLDFGNQSVISDPAAGHTLVLDHLKKEAVAFPHLPALPGAHPPIPGAPPAPAVPGAPPPTVQNLGKKLIDGHEVEGKLFTMHPPPVPPAPPIPKAPALPQAGLPAGLKLPKAPPVPAPPALPKIPQTVETWTSTKLHMPVLTTVTGSFGQQISRCKCSQPAAPPPPSAFQVPPGYKLLKKML